MPSYAAAQGLHPPARERDSQCDGPRPADTPAQRPQVLSAGGDATGFKRLHDQDQRVTDDLAVEDADLVAEAAERAARDGDDRALLDLSAALGGDRRGHDQGVRAEVPVCRE